jgi:hypothetical protein
MRDRLGVFFIAATVAAARQTPPAPTFRAGARLVQVDVIARDKKGPEAGATGSLKVPFGRQ